MKSFSSFRLLRVVSFPHLVFLSFCFFVLSSHFVRGAEEVPRQSLKGREIVAVIDVLNDGTKKNVRGYRHDEGRRSGSRNINNEREELRSLLLDFESIVEDLMMVDEGVGEEGKSADMNAAVLEDTLRRGEDFRNRHSSPLGNDADAALPFLSMPADAPITAEPEVMFVVATSTSTTENEEEFPEDDDRDNGNYYAAPRRRHLQDLERLEEQLVTCKTNRRKCSDDLGQRKKIYRKKNNTLAKCNDEIESCTSKKRQTRGATERLRENFGACQYRENKCKGELKQCRLDPVESPCSSYEAPVYLTSSDAADFCGATLDDNTAYFLQGDVSCDVGPTLGNNTCLDCLGNTVEGPGQSGVERAGIISSGGSINNCRVKNFYYGIECVGGEETSVTNVHASDNRMGMFAYGHRVRVECSRFKNNAETGMESYSHVEVSGCDFENNSMDLWTGGSVQVNCSEFRNARIFYANGGAGPEMTIRDSVFAGPAASIYLMAEDEYSWAYHRLSDVTACNGGGDGLTLLMYDWELVEFDDVTCDGLQHPANPNLSCEKSCPSNLNLLAVPHTCPFCPNGVGTYEPPPV